MGEGLIDIGCGDLGILGFGRNRRGRRGKIGLGLLGGVLDLMRSMSSIRLDRRERVWLLGWMRQ